MKANILVIDDDERMGKLLEEYLFQFGYEVMYRSEPLSGLSVLQQHDIDLLILDVMMPELDGFEVLKKIRARDDHLPVIMLTARGDVMDKVLGLELGADDYLPKPFEPRELVARVQSVLRRRQSVPSKDTSRFRAGELVLDTGLREGLLRDVALQLTSMEYELLKIFMQQPEIVLDRDQLMNELRGLDWDANNRSIDVSISRLRQKLGDNNGTVHYIKTVWGKGYKFVQQVEFE